MTTHIHILPATPSTSDVLAHDVAAQRACEDVMAITVNIHEAKTHLSQLLQRVIAGEEIILAKAGKPIARLVPFTAQPTQRLPGSAKGQIWIAPDFDAPLPDEILAAFEGQ